MNILEIFLYSFLIFLIIYFGFRNIKLRKELQDEKTTRLQLSVDRNIIISEYTNLLQELENKKLEKSDDFVKFLSDSRNAAFDYIEKTQGALLQFDKEVQQIFDWSETYGTAVGNGPHAEKIKDISLAYQKLKELLPENTQTPND